MHERSLVQSLLRQLEELRLLHAAEAVLSVNLTVGEFSGVEPELLKSAFEEMALSTASAGAELTITRVPLECVCRDCGETTRIERFHFECSGCKGRRLSIVRGEDMMLESVTLSGGTD